MKILFKKIIFIIFIFINFCSKNTSEIDFSKPVYKLSSYYFNTSSSIESRIKKAPDFVLSHLREMDKKNDYNHYLISEDKKAKIIEYIELLPPLNKKIIKERLVGIYFIQNLISSGYTDFILNEKKEIYFYIALNPLVFQKNISELLTYREMSCFINNSESIQIKIDCGSKFSGLFYILIHETTHCVDYVNLITPYVEDSIKKIKNISVSETPFTKGIWKSYNQSYKDYFFRKNLTFYGTNQGPKIPISESINIYKDFEKSNFASLYSSLNWAEDLADFITFYHLTQILKQKYRIIILKHEKKIYFFEPFNSINRLKRAEIIKFFYQ